LSENAVALETQVQHRPDRDPLVGQASTQRLAEFDQAFVDPGAL